MTLARALRTLGVGGAVALLGACSNQAPTQTASSQTAAAAPGSFTARLDGSATFFAGVGSSH